jgi:adenylosuccinate synthase
VFAYETATLRPWVKAAGPVMADRLRRGERVVVEGTQGFGLSVLHSHTYPFVTSRDTTASAALSEAGLSPLDVTEVALVLRAFPIRVGGHSGPLPSETSWADIRAAGCHDHDLTELTSVTRKPRRVGRFDPSIVREAIDANSPTVVVMNHVDHVDHESCMSGDTTGRTRAFVRRAEAALGRSIDLVGTGPGILHKNGRDAVMRSAS